MNGTNSTGTRATRRRAMFDRAARGVRPGRKTVRLLLAAGAAVPVAAVQAQPSVSGVVAGEASVTTSGSHTTITAGDNAIIEYHSFGIGVNETVQFVQPTSNSRVLNRVVGGDPSRFEGTLIANGRVYFVNPAGIYFSEGALVDVGAIYAAAGSISNDDFLSNIDQFTALAGRVENLGTIEANAVHLLGRSVANYGNIVAPEGTVTMISGTDALIGERDGVVFARVSGEGLTEGGVEQQGNIDASGGRAIFGVGDTYSIALGSSSTTRAASIATQTGADGSVVVEGRVLASDGNAGGSIDLLGDKVGLWGAVVDASGADGGGTVRIGGDLGGAEGTQRANQVYIDADSSVRADATGNGDGGTVILWSDDLTSAYGDLSARGGLLGGNGGFIETSTGGGLRIGVTPDVTAPAGDAGTWLIDPIDLSIVAGNANATADETGVGTGIFETTVPSDPATIGVDLIEAALTGGASVIVRTTNQSSGTGNISLDTDLDYNGVGGASLTLQAIGGITINGSIADSDLLTAGDSLNLTLDAFYAPSGVETRDAIVVNDLISLGAGSLSAEGLSFTSTAVGAEIAAAQVNLDLSGAAAFTNTAGLTFGTVSVGDFTVTAPTISLANGATATGVVSLTGATSLGGTLSGLGVTVNGPLTLSAISSVTATVNGVTLNGTVDGAQGLTLDGGAGAVTITGAIGGTTPVTALSTNGSSVTLNAVTSAGSFTSLSGTTVLGGILSTAGDILLSGNLRLAEGFSGTISTGGGAFNAGRIEGTDGGVSESLVVNLAGGAGLRTFNAGIIGGANNAASATGLNNFALSGATTAQVASSRLSGLMNMAADTSITSPGQLSAGTLTLNSGTVGLTGGFNSTGDTTITGGTAVAVTGSSNADGTLRVNGPLVINGGAPVTLSGGVVDLDAVTLNAVTEIQSDGLLTLAGGATQGNALTLTADDINLTGAFAAGVLAGLTVQTNAADTAIAVGAGTPPAGALVLDTAEITNLGSAFNAYTFGRSGGTHAFTLGTASFNADTTFRGGSATLGGTLASTSALTLDMPTVTLAGATINAGTNLNLTGSLGGITGTNTLTAGTAFSLASNIDGSGSLSISAPSVTLSGVVGGTTALSGLTVNATGGNATLGGLGTGGAAGVTGATSLTATGTVDLSGTNYNANQQTYTGAAIDVSGGAATAFNSNGSGLTFSGPLSLANGSDTTLLTGGGALSTGAIDAVSDAALTVDAGASNVTFGALGATGSLGDLTLTAGTLSLSSAETTGNVSLTADEITLTGLINGSGNFTLRQRTDGTRLVLNSLADNAGDLDLSSAELGLIGNGFNSLTLGSATSTAGVRHGPGVYVFGGDLTIETGVSSGLDLAGDLGSSLGTLTINGPVQVAEGAAPTLIADNGVLNVTGSIYGTDGGISESLTLFAGTDINAGAVSGNVGGAASSTGLRNLALNGSQDVTIGSVVIAGGFSTAAGSTDQITVTNAAQAGSFALTADQISLLSGFTSGGVTSLNATTGLNIGATSSSVGSVTLSAPTTLAGTLSTTAGNITLNGATTLSNNAGLDAGAGILTVNSSLTAGANDLTLTAGTLNLGAASSLTGSGALLLQPNSDGVSIGLGDLAVGTYNLTTAELGRIANGFSQITIGRATGQHAIDLRTATFSDNLTIRATGAGSITQNGPLTMLGASNVTLQAPTLALAGSITTGGGDVSLLSPPTLAGALNITTNGGNFGSGGFNGAAPLTINAGGGNITLGSSGQTTALASLNLQGADIAVSNVRTTGAQSYTASNELRLNGLYQSTLGGQILATGPILLNGATTVQTAGNAGDDAVFAGAITGAQDLNVQTGAGSARFQNGANVQSLTTTGASAIAGGAITTANDATFNGDLIASGATTLNIGGNLTVTGAATGQAGGGAESLAVTIAGGTAQFGSIAGAGGLADATGLASVSFAGTPATVRVGTLNIAGSFTGGSASTGFDFTNLASAGSFDLTNNGTTFNSGFTSGGNASFNQQGGTLAINAPSTAAGLFRTLGTGSVNAGMITAGSIESTGSVLTYGALTTTGNMVFTPINSLNLNGLASAGGSFRTTGSGSINAGAVNAASIDSAGSALNYGALTSTGDVTFNPTSTVVIAGPVNAGGTIAVGSGSSATFAGTVTAGSLDIDSTSASVASVNTAGSQSYAGSLTLGGDLDIGASGALTLGGPVTLAANSAIRLAAPGAAFNQTQAIDGPFTLLIDAGPINLSGAIGRASPLAGLTLNAAGALSLSGSINTTGAINATANSAQLSGLLAAAGPVTIASPGTVSLLGGLDLSQLGGSLSTTGTGNVLLTTDLTAPGDLSFAGALVLVGGDRTLSAGRVNLGGGVRTDGTARAFDLTGTTEASLNGAGTAGSELSRLTVTAPTLMLGGDIFTLGTANFNGATRLTSDTSVLAGDTIDFASTIDSAAGMGPFGLTLVTDLTGVGIQGTPPGQTFPDIAEIRLGDGIGQSAQLSYLRLNYDPSAGVDGHLNIPAVPTIIGLDGGSSGVLGISVVDDFSMGRNEKMTVFGGLQVNGTSARLGDISVLDDVVIATSSVVLLLREAGPVLAFPDMAPLRDEDLGADIVAGGTISLPAATSEFGSGQPFTFASGTRPALEGGASGFTVRLFGDFDPQLIRFGGRALDLRSQGATNSNVAEALAALTPRTDQIGDVPQDTAVGRAQREELERLGIYARDLGADQLVQFLVGRALYEDAYARNVSNQPQVSVNRLSPDLVGETLREYRRLFAGADTDPETGLPVGPNGADVITDQLAAALDDYQAQAPAGPFDPDAFWAFLAASPDHADAAASIRSLDQFFESLALLGLSGFEYETARSVLLSEVRPGPALNARVLQAVIEASSQPTNDPAEGTVSAVPQAAMSTEDKDA